MTSDNDLIPLSIDEHFRFSCSKQVPCFNECCRDLNQFLTPYDILRLKNHLGISSTQFLEQYTFQHTGPQTSLPVIILKTQHSSNLRCPFVTPDGCSVYENRPASCRTYPLARLVSRSRETGKLTEHYALMKEAHCKGHEQDKTQSVREWITDQGLEIYSEMNDLMMDVIALKNQYHPEPLDMKTNMMFHLALYDSDRFRTQIFENGLLDKFSVAAETLKIIRHDDTALLKLGIRWICSKLTPPPSPVRRGAGGEVI